MITITLSVLLFLSLTTSGVLFRSTHKLSNEKDRLRKQLVDMICGDDDPTATGAHTWVLVGNRKYTWADSNNNGDVLRSMECSKCGLVKRYWIEGWADAYRPKSKQNGYFRVGERLDTTDENTIPCSRTGAMKLLLDGKA